VTLSTAATAGASPFTYLEGGFFSAIAFLVALAAILAEIDLPRSGSAMIFVSLLYVMPM
jgi:hypothetical protein